MRVSSRPALPTRERPGSKRRASSRPASAPASARDSRRRRRLFVAVADADAAAQVDVVAGRCLRAASWSTRAEYLVGGLGGRRRIEQLRADVAVDAGDLDVRQRRRGGTGQRFAVGDAELVAAQAGGNVGVRLGSTSGFTRSAIGARLPMLAGDSLSRSSSAADSTLKQKMPASSAWRISSRGLADAGEDHLAGSPPAARTRASSPPETMSKPAPSGRNRFRMARLELALTA
jgi:hypothetical protein